ncbi:MAG: hypothetical protein ACYCO9_16420 [Streptosporangiaceae bacterium]
MDEIVVALHVFVTVLVCGTLWRISTYHLLASGNSTLESLGKGMAIQY